MATTKEKKTREPLPVAGSKTEFNSEELREAAEKEMRRLRKKYEEDPAFKAILEFSEWARDNVGWRSFGRVLTTGKCER